LSSSGAAGGVGVDAASGGVVERVERGGDGAEGRERQPLLLDGDLERGRDERKGRTSLRTRRRNKGMT